jgi:Na+-translocating ferredoxin:NAD+ oxidoreductase RNF subunit RnfB
MDWLRIPLALGLVFLAFFAATFLSSAWERRRKRSPAIDSLLALLPGHDCGLCGRENCGLFARWILEEGGDPGLCSPGGSQVEERLRLALGKMAETEGRTENRSLRRLAFVRCGGIDGEARSLYAYDGRRDCGAAANLFEGPRSCEAACLGLGSCARVCPVGAISLSHGLAVVDPLRCTGCGLCEASCPKGLISLVPAKARWQVACNSHRQAEEKKALCTRACIACEECVKHSTAWEFSVRDNLARASDKVFRENADEAAWQALAAVCPTGAILRAGNPLVPAQKPASVAKKR